jgi:twitching motility protein PilJ
MERSTQDVVQGTKTADEADQALREIGAVSSQLAELIDSITQSTQQQAASATRVAANMKVILGITQLTTDGTKQTASSAARLTQLADGLKSSVAGFKLAPTNKRTEAWPTRPSFPGSTPKSSAH